MIKRPVFRSQTGRNSTASALYDHLSGQVNKYREEMIMACDDLRRVQPVFNAGRDARQTHCDFAISSLSRFESVQAIHTLLHASPDLPALLSEHLYPLLLSLCQMREQRQQLHTLLSAYRSVCQSCSPQVKVIRQKHQIYDAIEILLQSGNDVLSQIEHLLHEYRFLEQKYRYANDMDWSEHKYCEQDHLTTIDIDIDLAKVIPLRKDKMQPSDCRSDHP